MSTGVLSTVRRAWVRTARVAIAVQVLAVAAIVLSLRQSGGQLADMLSWLVPIMLVCVALTGFWSLRTQGWLMGGGIFLLAAGFPLRGYLDAGLPGLTAATSLAVAAGLMVGAMMIALTVLFARPKPSPLRGQGAQA